MPAYYHRCIVDFISENPDAIVGTLQNAYASDGFSSQYSRQTRAWVESIARLQVQLGFLIVKLPSAASWIILLEYPLYRLRKRIDIVVLAEAQIVVIECKVGARDFPAAAIRQLEEYALDLRDFHESSHARKIVPILWSTEAQSPPLVYPTYTSSFDSVAPTICVGADDLAEKLSSLRSPEEHARLIAQDWNHSAYRPVPTVIQAATSIFAGHDVRSIMNHDADNLQLASTRLIALIDEARQANRRYLLILSGVPGSGKTLAGLHVVHSARATDTHEGNIVYLSGNTPLVAVLREALALDERDRTLLRGERPRTLEDIRRAVRARIQHINDFLHQGLLDATESAPHEHVIVFDEAQRAWDEKQGLEKFNRTASEPELLLELMARHHDWCVCVCLIGGGQEINSGEEGVAGWGAALRKMQPEMQSQWSVFAPPDVLVGGVSAGSHTLGPLPATIGTFEDAALQLAVPQRSYRSPNVSQWVNEVLAGDASAARSCADQLSAYPIVITRSLQRAKDWLRQKGRGERRYGLLASSGARRLRADGIGTMLHAAAGAEIAQWYLNEPGDIRSSFALEVPANEYTCQGLELDFSCLCWGGDLLFSEADQSWMHARLNGNQWQKLRTDSAQRFLKNSYRVLLTRAREGMVLWIPEGDDSDKTRARLPLNHTADFLVACGAVLL